MSNQLQIIRAKPNPIGKDKTSGGVPKAEQLLGEWVDIKNIGTESVLFSSMKLSHTEYGSRCEETGQTETYWMPGGTQSLDPGRQVRVHTGRSADKSVMREEDRAPDWEAFAGRSNFILNNRCGDGLKIIWKDGTGNLRSDTASYEPNPPEGVVLTRIGNLLVSTTAARY
ncbi:MAG TPA: hypothetical protein VJR02_10070 [Pyrinomonadaceae bacterium]|nr:hypothetical protein [Pyrinomonadaceae bacterium]